MEDTQKTLMYNSLMEEWCFSGYVFFKFFPEQSKGRGEGEILFFPHFLILLT